jgi:hypothetical protein
MDTLKDIISDIRVFLYGGIATLPLTLGGTLLVIGSFTANYAILFFLVGFLIVAPASVWLLNKMIYVLALLLSSTDIGILVGLSNLFKMKTSDICKLVIPFGEVSNSGSMSKEEYMIISYWLGMVAFFIGYLIKNALQLYSRESPNNEVEVTNDTVKGIANKVSNRKSQALLSIISMVVFFLIGFGIRYYTGCEGWQSLLGSGLFIYGGMKWYNLLSSVGEDRLSDLFGIANRLLAPSAVKNDPIACVPVPV